MSGMFSQCRNLKSLDVSGFDTSSVISMYSMFSYCANLEKLDISNFDTAQVESMGFMFGGCSNLRSLDLSNFDMTKVNGINNLVSGCESLSLIATPSKIPTEQSITLPATFCDTELNSITELTNEHCNAIMTKEVELYVGEEIDLVYKENFENAMWESSDESVAIVDATGHVTAIGAGEVAITVTYDEGAETTIITKIVVSPWFEWNYDESTKILTVTGEANDITGTYIGDAFRSPFYRICPDVEKIVFKDSKLSGDATGLFAGLEHVIEIDVSGFDTSQVTDMTSMFYNCYSLTDLDLSAFDTSQVTSMASMFFGCYRLPNLDMSNFDTSKVTKMQEMFIGCRNLQGFDMSNFDMSQVMYSSFMFEDCRCMNYIVVPKAINANLSISLPSKFYDAEYKEVEYITSEYCNMTLTRDIELKVGATADLSYKMVSENDIWESSDESVAKVDDKGYLTAVGTGVAMITVNYDESETTDAVKVIVTSDVVDVQKDNSGEGLYIEYPKEVFEEPISLNAKPITEGDDEYEANGRNVLEL